MKISLFSCSEYKISIFSVELFSSENRFNSNESDEELLKSWGVDVIIPRGGKSLVERVQNEAKVPVFGHLEGICHVYIDKDADVKKAIEVTWLDLEGYLLNLKTSMDSENYSRGQQTVDFVERVRDYYYLLFFFLNYKYVYQLY